jgi:hypothetical protein
LRQIEGITAGSPGTLRIRLKWHAVNLIPNTFQPLSIQVKHGSTVLGSSSSCYSIHADKTPKCDISINVTAAEAARTVNWTINAQNSSSDDVIGFNISKAGDINPLVPSFSSTFNATCPGEQSLALETNDFTINNGASQERRIHNIGAQNGDVVLKMKWHTLNIIPNTFAPLRIEIMNGTTVITSSNCYSIHSDKTPKCSFSFQSLNRPADQWRIRVTNNGKDDVAAFNIKKDVADVYSFIPFFRSTYKLRCP